MKIGYSYTVQGKGTNTWKKVKLNKKSLELAIETLIDYTGLAIDDYNNNSIEIKELTNENISIRFGVSSSYWSYDDTIFEFNGTIKQFEESFNDFLNNDIIYNSPNMEENGYLEITG